MWDKRQRGYRAMGYEIKPMQKSLAWKNTPVFLPVFLCVGPSPKSAEYRPTATTSFSGMSEELPRLRCGKRGTFIGRLSLERSRKIPPPFSSAWPASHQAGHLSV